jgi:hypothetical protein
MRTLTLRALVITCGFLLCSETRAEAGTKTAVAHDARQDRLEGLSKDDLTRLSPQLEHGPVALIEFADTQADQLPAVNIALPVRASAELVTKVLSDPANFPRFMPTLDAVKIIAKQEHSIVYDWSFDLALFHMRGRNVMTSYPAPKGRSDAASRVTIDSDEGDLGRGRFSFRVHPRGAQSLLVVSVRLDLREANYIARQVAKAARSVNRSANVALGFSLALHVRSEAEREAGQALLPELAKPLYAPNVDVARLAPLLNRGDLLFFDIHADRLDQIAVVGAVGQTAAKVQSLMHDAKAFGSSLVPGSKAEIVSQSQGTTTFDWTIALPLLGVSGQMQLRDQGPLIEVAATQGALQGGRWLFELKPLAADITLISGWAHFDFSQSSWLLEKLVSADPYLGFGMIGASELMLLRAVRTRATQPPPSH